MDYFTWTIDIDERLRPYTDVEERKVVLLTASTNETQGTLEWDASNTLTINTGFDINVIVLGEKHIKLSLKAAQPEEFMY